MILTFRYEGNTPSKKNQKRILKTRDGRPFIMPSEEHKIWHRAALREMTLQRSAITGITFPLPRCARIYARLFYADRRRRDSSNTFESIMDLLVDAGILADDAWAITGPTAQFPELRAGRAGWELTLVLPEAAPGLAAVHQHHQEAKA